MAEKPKVSQNQSSTFVYKNKPDSCVYPWCSEQGNCVTTGLNKVCTDQVLEKTIVSNTGIKAETVCEPPSLTKREIQVLKSILTGKTNKQIARTLSRSCRTIEYHRNKLMHKLNARNAAELVKRAIAMGIA